MIELEIIKNGNGKYAVRNEHGHLMNMIPFFEPYRFWEIEETKREGGWTSFLWRAKLKKKRYLKSLEIVEVKL